MALKKNAFIVTNDRFRDHAKNKETLGECDCACPSQVVGRCGAYSDMIHSQVWEYDE